MNIYTQQKNKGFTMIEMIIAVFIFTLSLTALMTIASRGLRVANQAQQQVVANYLAIEGIEAVRNVRDAAFISGGSLNWQTIFGSDCSNGTTPCMFMLDSAGIDLQPCGTNGCRVFFSENQYAYRHITNPTADYADSGFTRDILFTPNSANPDEISIEVVVAWNNGDDEISYSENLFLWL